MPDSQRPQQAPRTFSDYRKSLARRARLAWLKYQGRKDKQFVCPLCDFHGPFLSVMRPAGERRFAQCPNCNALERHRIQTLVMQRLADRFDFSTRSMLHVAPERCLGRLFRKQFRGYTTVDLEMPGVDVKADLTRLPFQNAEYDVVYASHVLEHIMEDTKAISEIRRVLRPGGFAVLPVPIVSDQTVEYGRPDPDKELHVRAPGPDYYTRYEAFFFLVERFYSHDFSPIHQTFIYLKNASEMTETKRIDIVPVCFV